MKSKQLNSRQVRAAFWRQSGFTPLFLHFSLSDVGAIVASLARDGSISERVVSNVTL